MVIHLLAVVMVMALLRWHTNWGNYTLRQDEYEALILPSGAFEPSQNEMMPLRVAVNPQMVVNIQ